MKLKKLIPYFCLLLIICIPLAFYFTRVTVTFVYSPLISDQYIKNLSKPKRLSFKYRTSYKREGEELRDSDLIVAFPPAVVDVENAISINIGNGRKFTFDNLSLFEKALSGKSHPEIAILYNSKSNDEVELAERLKEKHAYLELIAYEERISVVNIDSIKEEFENLKIREVLIPSPSCALSFIEDTDLKLYMDFRDAAAFSGYRNIISINPDWDKAISDALSTADDVPFSFAFSTT